VRWLNPVALFGAVALVLPVLIHLFSRKQTRVVPFPSLRFVAVSPLLPTRRTRLSDVALLMVRLAILATAVAALAGPLWARNRNAGDGTRAATATTSVNTAGIDVRALVIDTGTGFHRGNRDSAAVHSLETLLTQLRAESKSVIDLPTTAPFYAIPGAVDWLQQQQGSRELVVVSDFRRGALDSADVAAIPRDISVRLIRIAAPPVRDTPAPHQAVVWWNTAPTAIEYAVRRAVSARGGQFFGADSAASSPSPESRRIVVTSADTDSLIAHLSRVTPLRSPWMGDVLAALKRDTALAVAMASVTDISDTLFSAPFVVVARSAQFVPLVAAAALPAAASVAASANAGSDSSSGQLLLVVRTADDAVATATLLLAASNAMASTNGTAWPAIITASDSGTTISDAQLRQWELAPTASPISARPTLRTDYAVGPSDARYLWVVVLVLIAMETYLRRRTAPVAPVHAGVEHA
jgi:hypothetical protein